ncbi:hypothetical protein OJ997_21740 [Solirubrobacter phytolaccae]|uniref:Uncharacterized protein n=1 Tax=Solirubrobacter phytolaccae TaxID=1404360 RepID=A0A9X3NAE1_9ACTN|nr:hypothetical protein [Solirubrobacter phytolaccae]MDA0182950.1 hypothetical protein [Solirubrobacter phytolaccae]
MSTASELLARLADGESPASILASLRPESEPALLARCAVVRTFDRDLFNAVLAQGGDFETLVQAPGVSRLPRTDGIYELTPRERERRWRSWWSDADPETLPPELTALLEKLVGYYTRPDQALDRLAQLALIRPEEAIGEFREQFADKDRRFDLAACQDLIDVLSDPLRERLLSTELKRVRDDRATLLKARSHWSAEYFQTATFIQPARFDDVYGGLFAPGGPRVLNAHAPGGRGKTTQLRALIARRLVPEQDTPLGPLIAGGRIPCVRVDFDLVDPVNAARYPWLILLETAAQLDDQLSRAPFKGLLHEYGWAVPLLRRNPSDPSRAEVASKWMRSEGARAAESVPRDFMRTLNEQLGDTPVLLVLDTLEEVHLRPQGDLAAPMQLLADLLHDCPGLRVILAGRHTVEEVLGPVAEILGPIEVFEVEKLLADEAERYLADRRGLEGEGVRAAIIDNAGGDPFKLALLADLVQEQPGIPPEQIRGYPADVIRLIRRIINRIDEPGVRWLLRYGVVPRTLTLAFVRDVMEPYLRAAMAGVAAFDPPGDDDVPAELEEREPPFPPDYLDTPDSSLDLGALWQQLRQYVVGSTGWVFEVADGATEAPVTLRFRDDVAIPMRKLLRRKGVDKLLHREAAEFYEARARDDSSERWERWMSEALYHRFQLAGHRAERFWRRALDEAGSSPYRREAIAGELLMSDYIDFQGAPLPWSDTEPMVAVETLVEARFEHAAALTERARLEGVPADDTLWSRAEQSRVAITLAGKRVVPSFRLAYIDAGLELRHGRHKAAEARLRRALTKARGHVDVARLRMLLGDALLMRGEPAALEAYRDALVSVSRLPASRGWQAAIRRRIIDAASALDRLKEAYDEYHKLEAVTVGAERDALTLLAAEQALRSGHLTWADERARRVLGGSGEWGAWAVRVTAAARRDPPAAKRYAQRAADATGRAPAGGGIAATAKAAWSQELLGVAAGSAFELETAFAHLEQARSLWQSQGEPEAMARCMIAAARLKLRTVGDVNAARQLLEDAERLTLPPRSDEGAARSHLRVELLVTEERQAEAATLARHAVKRLRAAAAPPRQIVAAAVQALAICPPNARRKLLDILVGECERITPVSARVAALEGLSRVPVLPGGECGQRLTALRRLLHIPSDRRLTAADRALLKLTLAEVARVAGDRQAGVTVLMDARRELRGGDAMLWVREWSRALDRIELTRRDRHWTAPADLDAFLAAHTEQPMLCAAFLIERAEANEEDAKGEARRLLGLAERELARAPDDETQWHARLAEAQARVDSGGLTASDVVALTAGAAALFIGLGQLWRSTKRWLAEPELGHDGGVIEVQVTAGDTLSVAVRPPTDAPRRQVAASEPPIAAVLATDDLERFSFALVERWRNDWIGAGTALGEMLLTTEERGRLLAEPRDVRIELADPRLHALPVELARVPTTRQPLVFEEQLRSFARSLSGEVVALHATRLLQSLLNRHRNAKLAVDGQLGPQTRLVLDRALAEDRDGGVRALYDRLQPGLEPGTRPLAILVHPSADLQPGDIGHSTDVGWLYEASGFTVWRFVSPRIDELRRALTSAAAEGMVPTVMHLAGSVRVSGGAVALSFLGADWYSEALEGNRYSDGLTAAAVDSLLKALPRDAFRPLVVVDIERPEGTTEAITHLLLRNLFAGDLFALGRCAAVLATGLSMPHQRDPYAQLVRALARRDTVGEVARAVRATGYADAMAADGLESALGPLATALYTNVPWLRPVSR